MMMLMLVRLMLVCVFSGCRCGFMLVIVGCSCVSLVLMSMCLVGWLMMCMYIGICLFLMSSLVMSIGVMVGVCLLWLLLLLVVNVGMVVCFF